METKEIEKKDETFMTREEVAKMLHINLVTLWRYTKYKRIPYYKVGSKLLFLKNEIIDFIRVETKSKK